MLETTDSLEVPSIIVNKEDKTRFLKFVGDDVETAKKFFETEQGQEENEGLQEQNQNSHDDESQERNDNTK